MLKQTIPITFVVVIVIAMSTTVTLMLGAIPVYASIPGDIGAGYDAGRAAAVKHVEFWRCARQYHVLLAVQCPIAWGMVRGITQSGIIYMVHFINSIVFKY